MSDKAVSNDILNRLLSYSENRVCAECSDPGIFIFFSLFSHFLKSH